MQINTSRDFKPFYDFQYTDSQRKVVEWLFMMFSFNADNTEELNPNFEQKIKEFCLSDNRKQVESGNGLALNKTPRQVYSAIYGKRPSEEMEHYRDITASWVGDVFFMLHWKYGIPHRELAELPWTKIYNKGILMAELPVTRSCENIIQVFHLQPRGNDPRLKY